MMMQTPERTLDVHHDGIDYAVVYREFTLRQMREAGMDTDAQVLEFFVEQVLTSVHAAEVPINPELLPISHLTAIVQAVSRGIAGNGRSGSRR